MAPSGTMRARPGVARDCAVRLSEVFEFEIALL